MSLDVYLESNVPFERTPSSGIFIRESGDKPCMEISDEEWRKRFPGQEPARVRNLPEQTTTLYSRNITHNLGKMARAAGIYEHLWRPDEINIAKARQLIMPLVDGLERLRAEPEKFRILNPENGWGTYEGLVEFTADYLAACCRYPSANVRTCR